MPLYAVCGRAHSQILPEWLHMLSVYIRAEAYIYIYIGSVSYIIPPALWATGGLEVAAFPLPSSTQLSQPFQFPKGMGLPL